MARGIDELAQERRRTDAGRGVVGLDQLDCAIDDPAFHQQHVRIGEEGELDAVDVTGDVSHR